MYSGKDFRQSDTPRIKERGDLLTQHPILRRRYRIINTGAYNTEWEPDWDVASNLQNEVDDLEDRVKLTENEINAASQRALERKEDIAVVMDTIENLLKRFRCNRTILRIPKETK